MESVDRAFAKEYQIVNDVVRQQTAGFAGRGFDLMGVSLEGSRNRQRFPVYHLLNQQTGMAIDISFVPASKGLNGGFTALIIKPVNQKMDLEDHLKAHGGEALAPFFTYRDPHIDLRGFAEGFFQMLGGLMDNALKPVIEGRFFEETPIDFMGYK